MNYKEGDTLTVKFKVKVLKKEDNSDYLLLEYEDGEAAYVSKSEIEKHIVGVVG